MSVNTGASQGGTTSNNTEHEQDRVHQRHRFGTTQQNRQYVPRARPAGRVSAIGRSSAGAISSSFTLRCQSQRQKSLTKRRWRKWAAPRDLDNVRRTQVAVRLRIAKTGDERIFVGISTLDSPSQVAIAVVKRSLGDRRASSGLVADRRSCEGNCYRCAGDAELVHGVSMMVRKGSPIPASRVARSAPVAAGC